MDKQKQIEEMDNDIKKIAADWTISCEYSCDSCPYGNCRRKIATFLVNAGYRKIPENAVVLTANEKVDRWIDLLIEFDEMGFEPTVLLPNEMSAEEYAATWKAEITKYLVNARKETAEKFAERLKDKLNDFVEDYEDNDGKIDKGPFIIDVIGVVALDGEIISLGIIDEICKDITEGKV